MCTYNRQIMLCKLYLVKLLEKSQVFWKASLAGPNTGEIFPSTSQLRLSLLEREWMSLRVRLLHNLATSTFSGTVDGTAASVYLLAGQFCGTSRQPDTNRQTGPRWSHAHSLHNENAREERRPLKPSLYCGALQQTGCGVLSMLPKSAAIVKREEIKKKQANIMKVQVFSSPDITQLTLKVQSSYNIFKLIT